MIVLGILLLLFRRRGSWLSFMGLRFWCGVPLIGKVAVLSRDDQRTGGIWFRSEKELCSNFYRYHPWQTTGASFTRATAYLNKAQELGRREMPLFGWAVVSVLLVAEALSFGILLAGYAAQNASLRSQTELGWLLAIVLAIVLLYFTHSSGRQLHVNTLLMKAREWFQNRPESEQKIPLRPMAGVGLDTDEIDDAQPPYIQLANRIKDHSGGFRPSYAVPAITLVIVSVIAGVSFYMREKVCESIATNNVLTDSAPATSQPNDITAILGQQTQDAQTKGKHDAADSAGQAAVAGFGVLAVLFLATQVLGVMVGFYFGFSGKESKAAAGIRGNFGSVEEFLRHHNEREDYVARIAQSWLQRLQRKLRRRSLGGDFENGIENRTFQNYVIESVTKRAEATHAQAAHHARVHTPAILDTPRQQRAIGNGNVVPSTAQSTRSAEPEGEAELRRRIEAEVAQKLQSEREAQIRAEIEQRERLRLGMEKPH